MKDGMTIFQKMKGELSGALMFTGVQLALVLLFDYGVGFRKWYYYPILWVVLYTPIAFFIYVKYKPKHLL